MLKPRLSAEESEDLVRRYQQRRVSGETPAQIAEAFGLYRTTLNAYLRRAGVVCDGKPGLKETPVEVQDRIVADFLQEKNMRQVAAKHGVSEMTVSNILTRRGVKWLHRDGTFRSGRTVHKEKKKVPYVPRRAACDETSFDTITPESAYWVGFLMADGCISDTTAGQKRLAIRLKAEDKDHLDRLRSFLKSEATIRSGVTSDQRGGSHEFYQMVQTSNRLCDALAKFGVVPRKSKKEEVKGGLEYNDHFWRGYIDGDGSVVRKEKAPCLVVVVSEPLGKQYTDYLHYIGCPEVPTMYPSPGCFLATTRKLGSLHIFRRLWANTDLYLPRKYERIQEHLSKYQ